MNWLDFVFFGPVPIWALVGGVIFLAFAVLQLAKVMRIELKDMRSEINRGSQGLEKMGNQIGNENKELKDATSELKADTFHLANLIVGLTKQLEKATAATEGLHEALRKIYFWIPLGDRTEQKQNEVS